MDSHDSGGSVHIRPARQADAPPIADLCHRLGYPITESEADTRLSELTSRPDHAVLVAVLSDLVVGWVHVYIRPLLLTPREAEIGGLIVHPDHRRKSIGKLLLTHAEAWSAQAGCAGVRLRSRQSRTAAHAFYLAVGYERTKTSYTFWKAIKN